MASGLQIGAALLGGLSQGFQQAKQTKLQTEALKAELAKRKAEEKVVKARMQLSAEALRGSGIEAQPEPQPEVPRGLFEQLLGGARSMVGIPEQAAAQVQASQQPERPPLTPDQLKQALIAQSIAEGQTGQALTALTPKGTNRLTTEEFKERILAMQALTSGGFGGGVGQVPAGAPPGSIIFPQLTTGISSTGAPTMSVVRQLHQPAAALQQMGLAAQGLGTDIPTIAGAATLPPGEGAELLAQRSALVEQARQQALARGVEKVGAETAERVETTERTKRARPIAQAKLVLNTLRSLSDKINTESTSFKARQRGVGLKVTGLLGLQELTTSYEAELDAWSSGLAKSLAAQVGVLTEQDIERTLAGFPSIFVSKAVKDFKFAVLDRMVALAEDPALSNASPEEIAAQRTKMQQLINALQRTTNIMGRDIPAVVPAEPEPEAEPQFFDAPMVDAATGESINPGAPGFQFTPEQAAAELKRRKTTKRKGGT